MKSHFFADAPVYISSSLSRPAPRIFPSLASSTRSPYIIFSRVVWLIPIRNSTCFIHTRTYYPLTNVLLRVLYIAKRDVLLEATVTGLCEVLTCVCRAKLQFRLVCEGDRLLLLTRLFEAIRKNRNRHTAAFTCSRFSADSTVFIFLFRFFFPLPLPPLSPSASFSLSLPLWENFNIGDFSASLGVFPCKPSTVFVFAC